MSDVRARVQQAGDRGEVDREGAEGAGGVADAGPEVQEVCQVTGERFHGTLRVWRGVDGDGAEGEGGCGFEGAGEGGGGVWDEDVGRGCGWCFGGDIDRVGAYSCHLGFSVGVGNGGFVFVLPGRMNGVV